MLESSDDAAQLQFATGRTKNPKQFAEKVAYLYSHPEEVSRDEIELVDGTILDRYTSAVRDKDGTYYGRIWTFRDITAQRKLEVQFRQSQKMEAIGQLAGGVAHDFNNILAVILLQAGLLKIQPELPPKLLEFAAEIEKATQRAANLTRQLLLFSQRQVMQMRDLDLNEAVTNIVKMLQRLVGEDVQMQFKLSPKPLLIHADPGMIDQILLNLTVNARDAMPSGGELIIETSELNFDELSIAKASPARPGSFACVSVTDTGCGMSPEITAHIFEPFFTTKDVGKGTGLGLATTFGIVQQHQGWINVYSEVGMGTTMRIYLPRLARTSGHETGWSLFGSLPKGTETILVVEDDSAVRLSMRHILSHLGYSVLEATTGAECPRSLETTPRRNPPAHHRPRHARRHERQGTGRQIIGPGSRAPGDLRQRLQRDRRGQGFPPGGRRQLPHQTLPGPQTRPDRPQSPGRPGLEKFPAVRGNHSTSSAPGVSHSG